MNCVRKIRILFTFYNLTFLIIGAIIVGLGIWIVADYKLSKHLHALVEAASAEKTARDAGYVIISIGGMVFFLSFVGCLGAKKESRFLLGVYTFLLAMIMILEMIAAVLILPVYGPELEEKTQNFLTQKLQDWYDYTDYKSDVSSETTRQENGFAGTTLDGIMVKFQCCGITNSSDFTNLKFPSSHSAPAGTKVPITCCQCENISTCTALQYFPTTDQLKAIRFKECRSNPSPTNSNIANGGCYAKLREHILLDDRKATGIGIGIMIVLLQLTFIVIGVYVYRTS